jgi:hypothetical protein
VLGDALKGEGFQVDRIGLFGTHSIQKCADIVARVNGCSRVSLC